MSPSRFCTSCGQQAAGEERFCTSCGAEIDAAAPQSREPDAPAQALAGPVQTAARPQTAAEAPPAPLPTGAAPSRGSSRPPWLAAGLSALIIVVVGAVVAIVLISAGGSPTARAKSVTTQRVQLTDALLSSRLLYASTQRPSYSALLPAGWHQVNTTLTGLDEATTVQSPVNANATITVGRVAKPTKTLSAQAKRVLKAASATAGFTQQSDAQSTLAGGRHAWVLAYGAGGLSTAYYLIGSCGNTYTVSATAPTSLVSVLRSRVQIVAGTLQGNC